MTASQQIDEALGPIKAAIIQHPFIVELTDGSLPLDAFTRYLAQNYLYLNSYAKALALVSARSLDSESVEFFARRAAYAIASEREFAADLAATIGIEIAVLRAARPSPTGVGYASFVKQAAALEPLPVALATLLPCYTVYNFVSRSLVDRGSPDERYQRWIGMYAGEGFEEGVRGAAAACDRVSAESGERELAAMVDHARTAAMFEFAFWDSAYRADDWPLEG